MNRPIRWCLSSVFASCLLLAAALAATSSLPAFASSTEEDIADSLFQHIDLDKPGLEQVKEDYENDDFAEALDAYRDYFIDKLAEKPLGKAKGVYTAGSTARYGDVEEVGKVYIRSLSNDDEIEVTSHTVNSGAAQGPWSSKTQFYEIDEEEQAVDLGHDLGGPYSGQVTIEYDVEPLTADINAVIGYVPSSVPAFAYDDLNIIVRLYDGMFDVFNGVDGYDKLNTVTYSTNHMYHVKMVVDLAAQTYDVWVTPSGGSETKIAEDYAFRNGAVNAMGHNATYFSGTAVPSTNPIGAPGSVDWFIVSPDGNNNWAQFLSAMGFTNVLAEEFGRTGDPSYMVKWAGFWEDYALNHYNEWQIIMNNPSLKSQYGQIQNCWQSRLFLAYKSDELLQQLSEASRQSASLVNQSITGVQLGTMLIMQTELALGPLVDLVLTVEGVPNQNLQAGESLIRASLAMDEFWDSTVWYAVGSQTVTDYLDPSTGSMLHDGTDLEQSFNYNGILLNHLANLEELYAEHEMQPDWLSSFREKAIPRYRMLASVLRPTQNLPGLSQSDDRNAFPQFQRWEEALVDETTERVLDHIFQEGNGPVPAFQSITFPFGGYSAFRTGWGPDDHHLFMKFSRRGAGHMDEAGNAIQLTAYGRTMLIDSGPPSYSLNEIWEPYNEYLASSFAHNTVLVDGQSQQMAGTPEIESAYTTPIHARWHTSNYYDVTEGRFDSGYEGDIDDVTHDRQVIFDRLAGIYIIVDRMNTSEEHTYSQMWNFAKEYAENMVTFHEGNQYIQTSDPEGPNVFIYNFTPEALSYNKYYGDQSPDPHRGWYHFRNFDSFEPAVDIDAEWSGTGDQLLVSAIRPVAETASGLSSIARIANDAGGTLEGFDAAATDGTTVNFRAADNKHRAMTIGDMEVTGEVFLLTTAADETVRGIVLGATSFKIDGVYQTLPGRNFEFVRSEDSLGDVALIRVPKGFHWESTGNGWAPEYESYNEDVSPVSVEDFGYGAGVKLNTTLADPGNGWTSGWKADAGLTAALDNTYEVSADGAVERSDSATYRGVGRTIDMGADDAHYFSFKVRIDDPVSTSAATRLLYALDGSNYFGAVNKGDSSSDMRFQMRFGGTTVNGPDMTKGDTYTIVVKLSASSAGTDAMYMNIYAPTDTLDATEPGAWDVTQTASIGTVWDTIGMDGNVYNVNGTLWFDDVRYGETWSDVMVVSPVSVEDFGYGTGVKLNTTLADPGNGWTSGWKADAGLTAALDNTYEVSADGAVERSDSAMYRGVGRTIDMGADDAYYFSFKVRIDDPVSTNAATRLLYALDGSNYFGAVNKGDSSSDMRFQMRFGGTTVNGPDMTKSDTYTIVVKLSASSAGTDTMYMNIYAPTDTLDATEPGAWDVTQTASIGTVWDTIGMDGNLYNSNGTLWFDDVRYGETWDDATQ